MKPALSRVAILIAAAAFGLTVAEIALRVADVSYPSFSRADAHRGFALRPGAEGLYTAEGRAWTRINADGLRDRERGRLKPEGTYRIALLGDSYTEARQVPLESTFGAEIERGLSRCDALQGRRVEAVNFGVSGYGTTQEYLTFLHHAEDYRPDLVVLAFVPGNDLRDNSKRLSPTHNRPFHVIDGGQLALDTSFLDSERYRRRTSVAWRLAGSLSEDLRVLQVLNATKNAWAARRQSQAMQGVARATYGSALAELGLDYFVYREPADETQAEAWTITESVLLLLRDAVKASGAEFLLVTASSGAQVDPDIEKRRNLAHRLSVNDLFYVEHRLEALAAEEAIEILTLAPPMAAEAAARGVFFHGFDEDLGRGHWNAAGHRFAGEHIARRVCDRLSHGAPQVLARSDAGGPG